MSARVRVHAQVTSEAAQEAWVPQHEAAPRDGRTLVLQWRREDETFVYSHTLSSRAVRC